MELIKNYGNGFSIYKTTDVCGVAVYGLYRDNRLCMDFQDRLGDLIDNYNCLLEGLMVCIDTGWEYENSYSQIICRKLYY